jgi:hypothetical protein
MPGASARISAVSILMNGSRLIVRRSCVARPIRCSPPETDQAAQPRCGAGHGEGFEMTSPPDTGRSDRGLHGLPDDATHYITAGLAEALCGISHKRWATGPGWPCRWVTASQHVIWLVRVQTLPRRFPERTPTSSVPLQAGSHARMGQWRFIAVRATTTATRVRKTG